MRLRHLKLLFLVTAFVPHSFTEACTSLDLNWNPSCCVKRDGSAAMRLNVSFTKEFLIDIALLEIPASGWTCLNNDSNMRTEFHIRIQNG